MNFKKLVITLIAMVCAVGFNLQAAKEVGTLQTGGGIKAGLTCTYEKSEIVDPQTGLKKNHYTVSCSDGSTFANVEEIIGSATGTPAWLTYSNFIGSYIVAGSQSRMPGATRAVLLFDGKPQLKVQAQSAAANHWQQKNYILRVNPRRTSQKLALPLPDETPDSE